RKSINTRSGLCVRYAETARARAIRAFASVAGTWQCEPPDQLTRLHPRADAVWQAQPAASRPIHQRSLRLCACICISPLWLMFRASAMRNEKPADFEQVLFRDIGDRARPHRGLSQFGGVIAAYDDDLGGRTHGADRTHGRNRVQRLHL